MCAITGYRTAVLQGTIDTLVAKFSDIERCDIERVATKAFDKLETGDLGNPVAQTVEKVVGLATKKLAKKADSKEAIQTPGQTATSSGEVAIEVAAADGALELRHPKKMMMSAIIDSLCKTFSSVEKSKIKKAVDKAFAKLQSRDEIDLEDPISTTAKILTLATQKILKKTSTSGDSDDESDDGNVSSKEVPAAWKRHVVVLGSGAVAALSSTLMPDTTIAIIATLCFFKFVKGYALHIPRCRRIMCLSLLAGGSIALQYYVPSVNLVPVFGGLGLEALSLTGKAWMKGKMSKDSGPEETCSLFKVPETITSRASSAIGSGASYVAQRVTPCLTRIWSALSSYVTSDEIKAHERLQEEQVAESV